LRILHVEDHDLARVTLATLLRYAGHLVDAYRTAEDARAAVRAGQFDAAVLDVRLPGQSGLTLAQQIAAHRPQARIVFLTAEHDLQPLRAAVPAATVFRKPVQVAELLAALAAAEPTGDPQPTPPAPAPQPPA
jgi:DNA-binding response OmpR family regulator